MSRIVAALLAFIAAIGISLVVGWAVSAPPEAGALLAGAFGVGLHEMFRRLFSATSNGS